MKRRTAQAKEATTLVNQLLWLAYLHAFHGVIAYYFEAGCITAREIVPDWAVGLDIKYVVAAVLYLGLAWYVNRETT